MRFKKAMDYIHISKYCYTISIILTLVGVISLAISGLNYSVDFRAGSSVDITLTQDLSEDQIHPILDSIGVDQGTGINPGDGRLTLRFEKVLDEAQEMNLKQEINKLDAGASFEVNTVDPEMAKELARNAIYSVLISCIGIIIYVSIRFEWRFALAAIVALLHDAFLVVAVFSIFRFEVDLTFIIAVLTIIGYSINDTIVIFDRIRENLRFAKLKTTQDLIDLVNKSVAQTIMRSIYTAVTVFIAALFLFLLGGESIRMFSLAMVIGLIFGAYSTIFIASPVWFLLKSRQKNKPAQGAS